MSVLDRFRLDGKTAWITGGTKGLGLTMAGALASAGANVIVTSRTEGEAVAVAAELCGRHAGRGFGMVADATDAAAADAVVARAKQELGGIDILVNNAGITARKSTVDLRLDEWRSVVDVNLTGPFLCSKAVLPGMIEKRWGRIIYIASILGRVGMGGRPAYVASKGAVISLARGQALEVARDGITVNAICPGYFSTPLNRALVSDPKVFGDLVAKVPMNRWAELHELEGAIVYLASDAASYVTGTTLTIDGGFTAQ
jgi:NAD(P)-dependent dehydrogenase (short-subunit alcohol dehydrogenase family)